MTVVIGSPWWPTLAPDHPSDEDLSPGTPGSREDGEREIGGRFTVNSFLGVGAHYGHGTEQS